MFKHGYERDRNSILWWVAVAAFVATMLVAQLGAPAGAAPPPADCTITSVGLTPLPQLGSDTYLDSAGGLFPGGENEAPVAHLANGAEAAAAIEPRLADGTVDSNGTVGIVTIGVSNTAIQSNSWIRNSETDEQIRPEISIVNGAQSGATVSDWIEPGTGPWTVLDTRLADANVSIAQVQAAWVNLPMRAETSVFPDTITAYRDDLAQVLRNLEDYFPNLEIALLSSRTYGGYGSALSPEPVAYEHGFGVKWLIEEQISGADGYASQPVGGDADIPWVTWGPYLWADGTTPNGSGLAWECSDFRSDGIHPSAAGAAKVATALTDHFKNDPITCPWFSMQLCPDLPEPPPSVVVSWLAPTDGADVAGRVDLVIEASEIDEIEWRVDDGSWNSALIDTTSQSASASWDSTLVVDGLHLLEARGVGATQSTTITVNVANGSGTAPVVALRAQCQGLTCSFDGSRSSGTAGTLLFSWDFGDGTTGTGVEVEHTYAEAGDYDVVLTVTDDEGTASLTTTVTTRSR